MLVVSQPLPAVEVVGAAGGRSGAMWHLSVVDAGRPRGVATAAADPGLLLRNSPLLARWRSARLREAQWLVATGLGPDASPLLSAFVFGSVDAIPVAGDFNGDGQADLGVYLNGEWFLDVNGNGQWDEDDLWARLGSATDKPVVGDWNGDGKDDIGILGEEWAGDRRQLAREPGLPDFQNRPKPVPKNVPPQVDEATDGLRFLQLSSKGDPRADLIDHVFRYGIKGDMPIAGDWDGDGIDTIGVFREGRWQLDRDGDGIAAESLNFASGTSVGPGDGAATGGTTAGGVAAGTRGSSERGSGERGSGERGAGGALPDTFEFGQPGDHPIVGDFDGDGLDEVGVFRGGVWIIDINHNHQLDSQDRVLKLGGRGDLPVVGDWNGDGADEPGIYGRTPPPQN